MTDLPFIHYAVPRRCNKKFHTVSTARTNRMKGSMFQIKTNSIWHNNIVLQTHIRYERA